MYRNLYIEIKKEIFPIVDLNDRENFFYKNFFNKKEKKVEN